MSQDPQMAGVVILLALVFMVLALVFIVLLVVHAVIETRRARGKGVSRINRWHREPARPEGAP